MSALSRTLVRGNTVPSDADVEAATAPLKAKIADLEQQLRSAQQPNAPLQPPQVPAVKLSAEDIATKTSIWESVKSINLSALINAYNSLDLVLAKWPQRIDAPQNRKQLYQDIANALAAYSAASKDLDILRSEYPNYRDVQDGLAQPNRSELERAAINFANAINGAPENPPPNFAIELRPLAGAFRREMDETRDWLHSVQQSANQGLAALSTMK